MKKKCVDVLDVSKCIKDLLGAGIPPGPDLVVNVFRRMGVGPQERLYIKIRPGDKKTVDAFPFWAWNIRTLISNARGTPYEVFLDTEEIDRLQESISERRNVLKETISKRLCQGVLGTIGKKWAKGNNLETLVDNFIMSANVEFLSGQK